MAHGAWRMAHGAWRISFKGIEIGFGETAIMGAILGSSTMTSAHPVLYSKLRSLGTLDELSSTFFVS
jgi:hypothetical protein